MIGWSRYFGLSDAITFGILQKMNHLLYLKLRRWAKRRTKSSAAGTDKYWTLFPKWSFQTKEGVKLACHSDYTKSLKEYVKVVGSSSPFDGNDKYWTSRLGNNHLLSRNQASLFQKQKGCCNLCKLRFVVDDILELDHILPLSEKGEKIYENLQLLHRHCHHNKTRLENLSNVVS